MEEAADVGDEDGRTAVAEVGADPGGFGGAGGDEGVGAATAKPLNLCLSRGLLPWREGNLVYPK